MQEIYIAKRIKDELEENLRVDSERISKIRSEFRDRISERREDKELMEDKGSSFLDRLDNLIHRSISTEGTDPVSGYRATFGKIAAELGDLSFLGLISEYWDKQSFEILEEAAFKAQTIYLDDSTEKFLKGISDSIGAL